MTSDEFNRKYKEFLEEGYYGLALEKPEAVEYLDSEFEALTRLPGFKYHQIKAKFNSFRFYATGVTREKCSEIEAKLREIYDGPGPDSWDMVK